MQQDAPAARQVRFLPDGDPRGLGLSFDESVANLFQQYFLTRGR
jgi:hypothetical protein